MEEQKPSVAASTEPLETPASTVAVEVLKAVEEKKPKEYPTFRKLRGNLEYLAVNIPLLIGVEFLKTPFDRLKTQTQVAETLKANFVERQSLSTLGRPNRRSLWIGLRANVYSSIFAGYLASRLSPSVTYALFGRDLTMVKDSHGLSSSRLFLLGAMKGFSIHALLSVFLYPLDMARTLLFCHSDLDPLTRITSPGKALSKCIEKNGTLSVYRGFSAFLLFGLAQSAITGSLLALSGGDSDKINKLALGILPLGVLALYPLEALLRNIQVGNLGLVAEKVGYAEAAKRTLKGLKNAPAGLAYSLASVGVAGASASLIAAAANKSH